MYVYHLYEGAFGARGEYYIWWSGKYRQLSTTQHWWEKPNSGSLEEQQACLSTDPGSIIIQSKFKQFLHTNPCCVLVHSRMRMHTPTPPHPYPPPHTHRVRLLIIMKTITLDKCNTKSRWTGFTFIYLIFFFFFWKC